MYGEKMESTIRIHLGNSKELDPYLKVIQDTQDFLKEAGASVSVARARSPEIVSAIIITIVGNIASHYVARLADALIAKKQKDVADVKIIVVYNNFEFSLPENRSGLMDTLSRHDQKVSILFLAADPSDATRLRLGEELREIQEKLQLAKQRERFDLYQRMSVRPMDISQALLDVQPQIVHFSGHGASTGALCFENHGGEVHFIQPETLAALFEQFANHVSCVVLNACFSEIQANAIAKHIASVIGMNKAIGDKAAIAFAIGFYQALGAGRIVEDAYKLGCIQIELQGIPEHLTPILIQKKANPSS